MTTQEAIEIVKETHPYSIKYQTDKLCIALQHLIQIAERAGDVDKTKLAEIIYEHSLSDEQKYQEVLKLLKIE